MQIIGWKIFVTEAFNLGKEVFVVHVGFLYLGLKMSIHLTCKAQIALLVIKKVNIMVKYLDVFDIFSKESAAKLPKCSEINQYSVDLESSKQPAYNLIYSLELVKLETPKTYLKINLANGFIWPSKSLAGFLILFV